MVDPAYREPTHIQKLAETLQKVEAGEIKKLMIFMPPRHGKSETASVKFPAWFLGRNPDKQIIHTSYSADLSNSFSRRVRNLICENEYREIFPGIEIARDSSAVDEWHLEKRRGSFKSSGVGGAITGHGADLLIIDDPIKNHEEAESEVYREKIWEWYRSVLRTRLEPNGCMVLIMTRWHIHDLAGKLLESDNDWHVIKFPALAGKNDPLGRKEGDPLWDERYPRSELLKIQHDSGSRNWSALFQCEPKDPESQIIKREWIQWFDALPTDCVRTGGIDTASSLKTSADDTSLVDVCRSVEGYLYVDDTFCEKVTSAIFAKHVCAQHAAKKYRLIRIEANNAGEVIKQRIDEEGRTTKIYPPVEAIKTDTDKIVRVMAFQHLIENGTIRFKRGNKKVAELVEHLINFDGKGSDIDDDVDALGFAIKAQQLGESTIYTNDWDIYGQQ